MTPPRGKKKKRLRLIRTWKAARPILERWRRASASIEVELRTPREIDAAAIDFIRGEPTKAGGKPKRVFRTRLLDAGSADIVVRRPSGAILVIDLYEIVSLSDGTTRIAPE